MPSGAKEPNRDYLDRFGRVSIDHETDLFSKKLLPTGQNFIKGGIIIETRNLVGN